MISIDRKSISICILLTDFNPFVLYKSQYKQLIAYGHCHRRPDAEYLRSCWGNLEIKHLQSLDAIG